MLPRKNILFFLKRALILSVAICLLITFLVAFQNSFHVRKVQEKESVKLLPNGDPLSFQASKKAVEVQNTTEPANHNVHIFYYPWYGNMATDNQWLHWNHEYLPNWDKKDKTVYPTGRHVPPDDIGANFYPLLNCYSSRDPHVIDKHMSWIKEAGIGVLVISWYPPGEADKEGEPFDSLFPLLLNKAQFHGLKIAFHIEPYKDRNPENLRPHIKYIADTYGKHPALYRLAKSAFTPPLPVYYIYDSYLNPAKSWSSLLKHSGSLSVRNTELDGIFLGLVVELRHKQEIKDAYFDGFYTYFAANDFTYGSSWKNWKTLSNFAHKNRLLFIPSVGPGYVDTRVRPWNSRNTKGRKDGKYYTTSWKTAILSRPDIISITSFNEWHEGTQIEPAQPKTYGNYTYDDYLPNDPFFYMNLTRQFITEFKKS